MKSELCSAMMLFPTSIAYPATALFGLIFGSFLNVCIVRLPHHESIVRPRSRCPVCGHPVSWYDNIPLLSYLALSGKCRRCGKPISVLYPAVELLTAAVFMAAFAEFGLNWEFAKAVIFATLMIVVVFTDFRERIIPHSVTVFGIAVGLALSFAVPVNDSLVEWISRRAGLTFQGPLSSFAGAVTGGIFGAGLLYG
ncbi:MAG: prepilin peptidase, partial [Terriglobia bacterium]